jgi:hypothetical protein
MRARSRPAEVEQCPFLVPVTADSLWLYPAPAFCRRPGSAVRLPSPRTTLPCVCMTVAHLVCPAYVAGTAQAGDRVPA